MIKNLLAIDPGTITGWAFFHSGKLQSCGKWQRGKMLTEWCVKPPVGTLVLVEIPVIYPGGKAQAPDNDIVTLGISAGELAGRYVARGIGCSKEYVKPRNWKGTIPKAQKGERYIIEKRVMAVLNEREQQLIYSTMSARAKSPDHNMIDAVGIGLWRLDRKYRNEAK